jgi:ferredoxin--NADP+ reductase
MIVPNIHLLTLEAPAVAREARAGQFAIVRAEEEGERVPLTLADWDAGAGTVTLILMNAGSTTNRLARLKPGAEIPTVAGPLGNASRLERFGTVVCVGGCYGIGSMFPIARALKEAGNRVIMVFEGRGSYLFYWEERYRGLADRVFHITRDGSKGRKGHAGRLPEILSDLQEPVHRVFANGCTYLMKRVSDATRPAGIPTMVSLNPIMIDGTGMCGVCRVTVGGAMRFACVHGPDFDGHQVDWEELLQRRKTYAAEETLPFMTSRAGAPVHADHEPTCGRREG